MPGVGVVEVAAPGVDVAEREHAGPVAQDDLFPHPVRDGPRVVLGVALRSMTGLMTTWVSGLVHHWRTCSGDTLPPPSTVAAAVGPGVDVDDDLACLGGRLARGVQVQGQLPAGQHPDGLRAAHVEGLRRPQRGEVSRAGLDGVLEVAGVGRVQAPTDPGDPVVGDVLQVDVELPLLRGSEALLLRLLGVEPDHRFLDEPLHRDRSELVRERRHVGVHERHRVEAERHRRPGGPPSPPRHQVPGEHPGVGLGQPVGQLDGLAEEHRGPVVAHAQRGGELGDAELGDLGCPRARR